MDLDLAIKLCQTTREDTERLLAALEGREFYALGQDIGRSAVAGMAFKGLPQELVRVEQLITVDNLHPGPDHECPISDLVNYYDRILDQVRTKGIAEKDVPPIIASLHRWRDTAGRLAQMICQIDED